uniref:Uncharacterized protein n=1 Tax=Rhizophora mucronata TaxID=61149 RepID=A0A2P2PF50_RHIMU
MIGSWFHLSPDKLDVKLKYSILWERKVAPATIDQMVQFFNARHQDPRKNIRHCVS